MPIHFENSGNNRFETDYRMGSIHYISEDELQDSNNHYTYITQYESSPELTQASLEAAISWFDSNRMETDGVWEIKNEKKETDFSLRNI